MMNQPNLRSLENAPATIPNLSMETEQPNYPSTMPHLIKNEHLVGDILHTILTSQNKEGLLSDLASQIGNLFTVDTCIIVSTTEIGINRVSFWEKEQEGWLSQSNIIDNLVGLSLNHEQLEALKLIDQTSSHLLGQFEGIFQQVPSTKTWLGITTQDRHQNNGLILLLKSNLSSWTDSDRELLTHISDSMAIAISQTQLQHETRTKSKYHSLLKNLSREISHSPHPDLLFKNCLTQICNTLELDGGMILMLKYQNPLQAQHRHQNRTVKGTVEVACRYESRINNSSAQDKHFFSFSDSALCQQAWQVAPQHLCFEANSPFPDLHPEDLDPGIQPSGSALLMMPLMGKRNYEASTAVVWGFLVLQHHEYHYWSEDELDLIDWVAVQISTAIVHHQTLSQVQSIVEERTAQLKWSLDVQAKLSEKMRHNIDRLQKLNQLKDDFMNSMSHELKTPLTSMKMAIMMLRQSPISPEMHEKYLNILEQEWNREYGLIKDLLTLQELESGELTYTPEELDLNQTINNLASSFNQKWQVTKGINLKTHIAKVGLKINTDAESFTNILNELLLNAGKYSAPDTTIELTVTNQITLKGKNIIIAIANYGAGITPEELPYIFDKFRRGQGVTDRAVPGTGLGLTLVQNLVEHLNGTIEVTSEPMGGDSELYVTSFLLKLPQFQPAIS